MKIKIIESEDEYEIALERIEELMDTSDKDSIDELKLLSMLVENYEDETMEMELPDPIEAIKFRMDQQGLTRKDMTEYIGSASKVSEVLSGKRPLSIKMIRALHEGLGISAEVLLHESGKKLPQQKYELANYPFFSKMFNAGYFGDKYKKLSEAKEHFEECLDLFFQKLHSLNPVPYYKKTESKFGDIHAIEAWQARVANLASEETINKYKQSKLTTEFLNKVAGFSCYTEGFRLVKEALNKIGVHFILVEHLPKTHIDGACFYTEKGNPIVAMTLRYNRTDNFWFTLMHELAHIYLGHVSHDNNEIMIDDTVSNSNVNDIENEADQFAHEIFIPKDEWKKHLNLLIHDADVMNFADKLEISPAIIAGHIRWEKQDYTIFSKLIGNGEVKKHFIS